MTLDLPVPRMINMTLREWFAGMAMHAMIGGVTVYNFTDLAEDAFNLADAMMAEREKL